MLEVLQVDENLSQASDRQAMANAAVAAFKALGGGWQAEMEHL